MSIERYTNDEITPWTGEHLHRYHEAKKFVRNGNIVLDLACGSSYGANILSQVPDTTIYAGDIDAEAISACTKKWGNNRSVHFEIMDATALRFDNNFFDVIVSLETIEHLTAYKKMVSEFSRVIKSGGTAIISTPNIKVSSPGGNIINPFHTQEFTYDELFGLLSEKFSKVSISGQKFTRYHKDRGKTPMHFAERLLLARGVRKLPYIVRNGVFSSMFGTALYPDMNDYQLFHDKAFIEDSCHVLFAVCVK